MRTIECHGSLSAWAMTVKQKARRERAFAPCSCYSPRPMAHDQPVAALAVALTTDVAPAVYSINRLRPDCLCFVLPESAKALVEIDVQPRLEQMPRRWDWVLLADADHFAS